MSARAKQELTNSPRIATDKVLGVMAAAEVRTFLVECANLPTPIDYPEHRPRFERWLKKWARMFAFRGEDTNGKRETKEAPTEHLELFAPIVRATLRRLWHEQDQRQRDWYCYRLRDAHRQMVRHLEGWDERPTWGRSDTVKRLTDYALQDVPRVCAFEAALYWLQLNQSQMLVCADPSCPAPYFFRAEKRQRYCSPECADAPRRASKLRWWNESPNSPKHRAKSKSAESTLSASRLRVPIASTTK
jgi:hypothetical protein